MEGMKGATNGREREGEEGKKETEDEGEKVSERKKKREKEERDMCREFYNPSCNWFSPGGAKG